MKTKKRSEKTAPEYRKAKGSVGIPGHAALPRTNIGGLWLNWMSQRKKKGEAGRSEIQVLVRNFSKGPDRGGGAKGTMWRFTLVTGRGDVRGEGFYGS